MIAYLQGTIQKKILKGVILNVNGVGYQVSVPLPYLEKIKEQQNIELYIHTKVREDDISLYGFETLSELEFFKMLLNVNGIGPKHGMEILSLQPDKVKAAILGADTAFLSKIPGIGKKTAERIIVELKNKISVKDIALADMKTASPEEVQIAEDAMLALQNLGYQRFEISRVLKKIPANVQSTEEIITFFLQNV